MTGFITQIESPNRFEIGALEVEFSANTECTAVVYRTKNFWYNPLLAPDMFSTNGPSHKNDKRVTQSIQPCERLKLSIGSWVRIEGASQTTKHLAVQKLAVYQRSDEVQVTDGAILEEKPTVGSEPSGVMGEFWLDGFPMAVDNQTKIRSMQDGAEFVLKWHGLHSFYLDHSSLNRIASVVDPEKLDEGGCVTYQGVRHVTNRLLVNRLYVWHCQQDARAERFARDLSATAVVDPDYRLAVPGRVKLFYSPPPLRRKPKELSILPDRAIQDYVTRVGMSVLPQYAKALGDNGRSSTQFHFYVVRSLGKWFTGWASSDNGVGNHKDENTVVPMPDGLILIPADNGIAHLHNEAQLAALLSDAVTKVLQRQRFVATRTVVGLEPYFVNAFGTWQEAQALRIGIRQLYLGGYDIREAPFAWEVASRTPIPNPVFDTAGSGSDVPWYTAYAFDYISKYYSDVDYSKLKRGEAEYAQFLDELRKADPDAFVEKK